MEICHEEKPRLAYPDGGVAASIATPRRRNVSNWYYFFAGAALSAGVGAASAFHVSRTYSHFPPFFMETERYLPVSTTFRALSFTA